MDINEHALLALNVALILQLAGLAFAVLRDPYIRRDHRIILLAAAFLSLTLVLRDQYPTEPPQPWLSDEALTLSSIYGYTVRLVVLALFMNILQRDWRPWVLVGVNGLVQLTALFSPVVFQIRDGYFFRGPLGFFSHFAGVVLLLWFALLAFRRQGKGSGVPQLLVLLLLLATGSDTLFLREYQVSMLTVAIVSCCLFFYIWLHLQFVREHERDLMAEQRIRIMMSQIQPHFLYNTLGTIQSFCLTDPEKAFDTIARFGDYLRQNLGSLDQPNLIPFQQELEHTKVYVGIEMLRFESLEVNYDIRDDDFELPALSVQPLVENAIRHGVRIRKRGIVTVSSYRESGFHVVEIRDNGKGFDVAALKKDGGTHIGLRNVRERIEKMCHGTMTIDSKVGEGTTVTLRLPAKEEMKA